MAPSPSFSPLFRVVGYRAGGATELERDESFSSPGIPGVSGFGPEDEEPRTTNAALFH